MRWWSWTDEPSDAANGGVARTRRCDYDDDEGAMMMNDRNENEGDVGMMGEGVWWSWMVMMVMMVIYDNDEVRCVRESEIGGKAEGLLRLEREGFFFLL